MKNLIGVILFLTCPTFIFSQTTKIGDTIKGGVVFHITENGDSALICGPRDAARYVNWADAKARSEQFFSIDVDKMARGWRMPTKEEMKMLRDKRDEINVFINALDGSPQPLEGELGSYYWTATEGEFKEQAWLQAFGFDNAVLMSKESNTFHVRSVQWVQL